MMIQKKIKTTAFLAIVGAMWPHSAMSASAYNSVRINPAVVSNPQTLSYSQCIDRYGMCGCMITGLVEGDRSIIDTDGDSKITASEMMTFKNGGMFNTDYLTDNRFLACHYEPIPPGPYSRVECNNITGTDADCVCVIGPGGTFDVDAQCYIKSITISAPQPVELPEAYCNTLHPDGFECFCTTDTVVSSGLKKCFVQAPAQPLSSDCFDEIRIFKGSSFSCVSARLWGAWSTNCCDLPCQIQEYDQGFDVMTYAQYGTTGLQFYTQYLGYEAIMAGADMAGQATFTGWANSYLSGMPANSGITSDIIGKGLGDLFQQSASYSGDMITSTLGQMTPYLGYIGTAYAVYQFAAAALNKCGQRDYELACKKQADLCIHVGGYKDNSYRYQSYMCYESQIARVVNQYGLPQLYPNGPYGNPEHPRAQGFSVGEFERLDFAQIPIEEELIKTMLSPLEAQQYFASTASAAVTDHLTPSVFTTAESESSLDSRTPGEIPEATGVVVPIYGECGAFPATTPEIHSIPESQQFNLNLCTQDPGRYYINYTQVQNHCVGCIGYGTDCPADCRQGHCKTVYATAAQFFPPNQHVGGFLYPTGNVYAADCFWVGDYETKFYSSVPWAFGGLQKINNIMLINVIQSGNEGSSKVFFPMDGQAWLDVSVWKLSHEAVDRGEWVSGGKCVDFDAATPTTAPTSTPELINACLAGSIQYNGSNLATANCFCSCPPLEEDMARAEPVCPRPHKSNLIQRTAVVNDEKKAIFNDYYNRSDVRNTYAPYAPNLLVAP